MKKRKQINQSGQREKETKAGRQKQKQRGKEGKRKT